MLDANLLIRGDTMKSRKSLTIHHSLAFLTILSSLALCRMAAAADVPVGAARIFDVRAYGAVGDGKSLDTAAINRAIDAAAAAGGGTVHVPAGKYLCYSIHLKSNIAIYIDQGATILAAQSPTQRVEGAEGYDAPEPNQWGDLKYQDFGHSHFHNSLIWGENLQNVTIGGPGLIDGNGGRGLLREASGRPVGSGNKAISMKLCRNVTLKDFSILNGGHFAILATGVDNFTVDNVKMDTNRDGIDVDCCRNVRISNCSVNSPTDDGICLKSSFALGVARATENVTITNCYVAGYNAGTMLNGTFVAGRGGGPTGRIKFGTESNGGFKNITISNIVFDQCRGFALESVDGGLLEDVAISNITMRDIVNSPIFLRLGSRMRGPEGVEIGKLRRVSISNVVAYNLSSQQAVMIMGIPGHPVEDVQMSNIRLYYAGGGTAQDAQAKPAEDERAYPEPGSFRTMPAYGFFIRHAQNIDLDNISVSYMKDDARPAFVLDDVKGIDMHRVKAQRMEGGPTFRLSNVSGFLLKDWFGGEDMKLEKVETKGF
jgi:polygalacturonase